jgi:hypothetical protein
VVLSCEVDDQKKVKVAYIQPIIHGDVKGTGSYVIFKNKLLWNFFVKMLILL